jgi:pimeloyl-ACP methyl ester carboxylesterase
MDPLLLIHGTGADASAWDAVMPMLTSRYRVIAYDRSGYGRTFAEHAEDARAVLDERAPGEAAYVVGWSGGGVVALELAAKYPDKVRRLALAEPPLWAKKAFDARMMLGMMRMMWSLARRRPRDAAAAFFRTVTRYRDGGGNGFDALEPARRERMLARADDVIAEVRSGTGETLTPARLRAIQCPTTLLLGTRSMPVFARLSAAIAALMPSTRTVHVDGGGHIMMLEAPEAFARAVIEADTAQRSSPAA